MKTGHDYFVEFQKESESYNDDELISRFNAEANNGDQALLVIISWLPFIMNSSGEDLITAKLGIRIHYHLNKR